MSITAAMKSKGWTVKRVAEESDVEVAHLSAYKSGSRTMGRKAATKLAGVLDESPETLMLANRGEVMQRAVKRGDRTGVLNAVKSMVEITDNYTTPGSPLDRQIEELTDFAIDFAESSGAAGGILMDDESDPYGYAAEGRDGFGRRVTKSFPRTATPEESAELRGSLADEDDGVDDEGRDSRGIRVRPMRGV